MRKKKKSCLKKHLSEEEMVNRKIDWIDEQVRKGKRKVLNSEQALGEYAKYLKPAKPLSKFKGTRAKGKNKLSENLMNEISCRLSKSTLTEEDCIALGKKVKRAVSRKFLKGR